MMTTRYGIQRTADGLWWAGANHWALSPIAARWFESWTAAELAALRDVADTRSAWTVAVISN